jgi:hypothetical protein
MSSIKNEIEFIKQLKSFEQDIKYVPNHKISSSSGVVVIWITKIFEDFIDIYNTSVDDVLKLLEKHKIFFRVKSFIIAELLFRLDKIKTKGASEYRDKIIRKHVFRVAS